MRPIWLPDGQLGSASSALPVLALAASIAASGHLPTPASLPSTPGGRIAENLVMFCSPSWRVRRMTKGVKDLALLLMLPAEKPGLKEGTPPGGQGPAPMPRVISKVDLVTIGLPGADQPVISASVV